MGGDKKEICFHEDKGKWLLQKGGKGKRAEKAEGRKGGRAEGRKGGKAERLKGERANIKVPFRGYWGKRGKGLLRMEK